jgi:hypothetical protein
VSIPRHNKLNLFMFESSPILFNPTHIMSTTRFLQAPVLLKPPAMSTTQSLSVHFNANINFWKSFKTLNVQHGMHHSRSVHHSLPVHLLPSDTKYTGARRPSRIIRVYPSK